jgi:NAD dependent epimerase/dehydratase
MKKAIVTGSDGFIGSHLVETLMDAGYQVRAFVLYNSFNSWGWLDTLPKERLKEIEIYPGDVRDQRGVRRAVAGMDIVFHLAALIGIPFSYHSPDLYIDTNVRGTLNILEACRDDDVERILVTSTSEVYGTARYVPIDEGHPLQGQSPYSASKIGADKIAESFHLSFGLPVITARPFNTYGPRQSARAVIPTIISQILAGNRRIKLGSLEPTRDLNYVEDTCRGLLALAKCDEAVGRTVNIGSGREISVGGLAAMIIRLMGADIDIETADERVRPKESEVERLLCDNRLIRELSGWEPTFSLEEGLHKTIDWMAHKANRGMYKHDIYNM